MMTSVPAKSGRRHSRYDEESQVPTQGTFTCGVGFAPNSRKALYAPEEGIFDPLRIRSIEPAAIFVGPKVPLLINRFLLAFLGIFGLSIANYSNVSEYASASFLINLAASALFTYYFLGEIYNMFSNTYPEDSALANSGFSRFLYIIYEITVSVGLLLPLFWINGAKLWPDIDSHLNKTGEIFNYGIIPALLLVDVVLNQLYFDVRHSWFLLFVTGIYVIITNSVFGNKLESWNMFFDDSNPNTYKTATTMVMMTFPFIMFMILAFLTLHRKHRTSFLNALMVSGTT